MTRGDAKMAQKKAKRRLRAAETRPREVSALRLEFSPHSRYFLLPMKETRFKLKHSLDSDEEDEKDEVKDSRLGDEDLSAQEDTTIVGCTPNLILTLPGH